MTILGIGGLRNNPACAILVDGKLQGAVEQSKVSRGKGAHGLPEESILACLKMAKKKAEDVDVLALALPLPAGADEEYPLLFRTYFPNARVFVVAHHAAHAASAYYYSGFPEATVLTLDRFGDFRCGVRWHATGSQMRLDQELNFPDSLGDLYSRVTELLGLQANQHEHRVQWLSLLGQPSHEALFASILSPKEEWPRSTDRSFFEGERVSNGGFTSKFYKALGLADGAAVPERLKPDIAASLQHAVRDAVLRMAGKGKHLCVAGGLFNNSLLVAALEQSGHFERVFVQPAAGNAGTALGAIAMAWHGFLDRTEPLSLGNFCLGPEYASAEIREVLENCKLRFRTLLSSDAVLATAVEQLKMDRILAWMQGRMEFGARALGNRSILASPVNPYSSENLNVFIKRREAHRKFAASVPAELASQYFEVGENARFLATVGRVRPEYAKQFSSLTFGDDTVRVHTVHEEDNPLYWRLLHASAKEFGVPVLFNTSFNLFADPLVCSPRDAVRSFYSSGIDSMLVGNYFLEK